jgi:hypothetical protein
VNHRSHSGQPVAGSPETAAHGGGIAGMARKRAPGHGFGRGLLLHVARDMANSTRGSGRWLDEHGGLHHKGAARLFR